MLLATYNPYIPWNVTQLYGALSNLRGTIGTAFNIGIWIFIILTGVHLVIKIVDSFGR